MFAVACYTYFFKGKNTFYIQTAQMHIICSSSDDVPGVFEFSMGQPCRIQAIAFLEWSGLGGGGEEVNGGVSLNQVVLR
jgi:hypothetical protein